MKSQYLEGWGDQTKFLEVISSEDIADPVFLRHIIWSIIQVIASRSCVSIGALNDMILEARGLARKAKL